MKNKKTKLSNRYYWNEYSLRGQFKSVDEFFHSLREYTFPLLDEIIKEEGTVFLKKTDFWQLKICSNTTLNSLKQDKNLRYGETAYLKLKLQKLQKLMYKKPYWDEDPKPEIGVIKYKFDTEYCESFGEDNCFLRALENRDNIISFWHSAYQNDKLYLDVKRNAEVVVEYLHNFASKEHLSPFVIAKKWDVTSKIQAFIRLKEPDNHKPHFHVECQGYSGSFDLFTGETLKQSGKSNLKEQICIKIQKWHKENLEELSTAWNKYHGCRQNEYLNKEKYRIL